MSRSYRNVGIALVVAFLVLALGSGACYYYQQVEQAQRAADEYRAYSESLIECDAVESLPARDACLLEAIQSEQQRAYTHSDLRAQQNMAVWALGMLWVSVAMLIVTGVGVVYVARTLDQTRIASEAATDATIAANRTADLTEQTLLHIRDHSKVEMRAYVAAERLFIEDDLAENVPIRAVCDWRNAGQTPALKARAGVHFSSTPAGKAYRLSLDVYPPAHSRTQIAAGGAIHSRVTASFPVDKTTVDLIKRGEIHLYFWGVLEYEDVFGDEHHTKFRGMITGDIQARQRLSFCQDGNEAT